ncbi:Phosphotransferase enzyme family, partial [Rhizoctonia solani]
MEPLIYLTGSPPDPRSLELPDTSPAMPTTPLPKTPSMAIRALDSLRDSHLVPMSPRLEVSQPHSPKPDHEDERREAKADGDNPFPIDRNILRTVIREKLGCEPSHIKFLSSGTFHKAFLVSLVDGPDVVARIARRYMPKLKTESEIATINYVRAHTNIPVPFIYAYDSDPYNKLGGEYIIMSKAPGVPLIRHFHSMPANKMNDLLHNLAEMLVPLSQHTFPAIGSLYQHGELCPPKEIVRSILRRAKIGGDPGKIAAGMGYGRNNQRDSGKLTLDTLNVPHLHSRQMRPSPLHESTVLPQSASPTPLSPLPSPAFTNAGPSTSSSKRSDFYVGPIVAWPFFGSGRGELPSVDRPTVPLSDSPAANKAPEDPPKSPTIHDPDEIDRGPFPTLDSYVRACVRREVEGVRREQEKTGAAHKPHLVPASEERGHHHTHGHGHGHGHAGHHHSHGRRRASDELHVLNPAPKRRRRVRSGLGSLGTDGLGSSAPKNRRAPRGLGSLGNGKGPISSTSSTSTPSLASSDSDSDSDSEGSCTCSDSSCSCSSGSGSSEESGDVYSDEEAIYGDYRAAQRSSLFVGLNLAREGAVKAEMERWARWLAAQAHGDESDGEETAESSGSDDSAFQNGNGRVGATGFVGIAPVSSPPPRVKPVTPAKLLSPPRGVGVGGGGFIGVGPALPEPAKASSPSPTSPVPRGRGVGVGVGAGGFVGVGPGPSYNTSSGTGFVGVGVGGGFLNVGGIPSPPEPSSPVSPISPTKGFAGGFGVGVGVGGFLSVAAPTPAPPPAARGIGIGAGGFLSVGAAPEPPKPVEKKKKKAAKQKVDKDELGDFVLDLHDLSLANIFVDSVDSSKITCIIDWESTTIRPFWQAAHLPTFLVSATNAHSHPVTPRLQSTRISKGVSQADSRMSHQTDSRHSHRTLGPLGNGHLPSSGAASGMASIAALTAALNDYAQGMNDAAFGSPKYSSFGDSPRAHHFGDSSPRFPHSPQRRYATLAESPRFATPPLHSDMALDSAPRTAVLSRQHLQHSHSYPVHHTRRSGANTAVNTISALRPNGAPRTMSQRSDVHAHFEEAGLEHDHEFKRHHDVSGGETPRRITREEAAEWFKRIVAEVECPTGCGDKKEKCGERWIRAERERASWRVAHRAVEWDGWELGLVESVLEDARTLQGDMDF